MKAELAAQLKAQDERITALEDRLGKSFPSRSVERRLRHSAIWQPNFEEAKKFALKLIEQNRDFTCTSLEGGAFHFTKIDPKPDPKG